MDQKTISISEKSKFRLWHIEAPGCIINIRPNLIAINDQRVTSIQVLCDQYADEEKWLLPDFQGATSLNVRVMQGQQKVGLHWFPQPQKLPELPTLDAVAAFHDRTGTVRFILFNGVLDEETGEIKSSPGLWFFGEVEQRGAYRDALDQAEEYLAVLKVRLQHKQRDWVRFHGS